MKKFKDLEEKDIDRIMSISENVIIAILVLCVLILIIFHIVSMFKFKNIILFFEIASLVMLLGVVINKFFNHKSRI